MSEYNEKSKAYSLDYAKRKLKRVPLDLPLEEYDRLKETAEARGEKVNEFIKKSIKLRMEE